MDNLKNKIKIGIGSEKNKIKIKLLYLPRTKINQKTPHFTTFHSTGMKCVTCVSLHTCNRGTLLRLNI